jgi:hypothetical protein
MNKKRAIYNFSSKGIINRNDFYIDMTKNFMPYIKMLSSKNIHMLTDTTLVEFETVKCPFYILRNDVNKFGTIVDPDSLFLLNHSHNVLNANASCSKIENRSYNNIAKCLCYDYEIEYRLKRYEKY